MQVNRAYSVGTRSVKTAIAVLTDLPIEKLNESLVLGVSESGEAESFPLQIKKWLRGPLNNRGKTRGAFGGDWNKAHGVVFAQAERIPLPHWEWRFSTL